MLEKQYKQKGKSTLSIKQKPINFSIQDSYMVLSNLSRTLYKDSLLSSLRELIVNGLDAIKMLSNKTERENSYVYISLSNLDSYKENKELDEKEPLVLTIRDEGIGMSRQFLETDFVTKGKSNKLGDANTTGGFGLGFMSLFYLGNLTTIESIHNGEYCKYSVQDTGKTFQLVFLEYKEVDKSVKSGTTLTITLKKEFHKSNAVNKIKYNIESLFCTNDKVLCLTNNIKHNKISKIYETDTYYITQENLSAVDVNGVLYKEYIKDNYKDSFFITPKFIQNVDVSFSLSRESFDVSFSSVEKLIKKTTDNVRLEFESIFRKTRLLKDDDEIIFNVEDLKKLYDFLNQKDLEKVYTLEEISFYCIILESQVIKRDKVFIDLAGVKFNYYFYFNNLRYIINAKTNILSLYNLKSILEYTIKLLNSKIVNTSKTEYDRYLKENDYGRFVFSKLRNPSKDITQLVDFIKEKALTGKDMYRIMKSTITSPSSVKYEPNPDIKDLSTNQRKSYDTLTKDNNVYYIYGTYKESYNLHLLCDEIKSIFNRHNINYLSLNQRAFYDISLENALAFFELRLGLNVSKFIPIIKESELEVVKSNPNFIHYKDLYKHLDFKQYIEDFLLTVGLTKVMLNIINTIKNNIIDNRGLDDISFATILKYFEYKYPNVVFHKYFLYSDYIYNDYINSFQKFAKSSLIEEYAIKNNINGKSIQEGKMILKQFEEEILQEETLNLLVLLTKVKNDLNTPEELDFLINGKK